MKKWKFEQKNNIKSSVFSFFMKFREQKRKKRLQNAVPVFLYKKEKFRADMPYIWNLPQILALNLIGHCIE